MGRLEGGRDLGRVSGGLVFEVGSRPFLFTIEIVGSNLFITVVRGN